MAIATHDFLAFDNDWRNIAVATHLTTFFLTEDRYTLAGFTSDLTIKNVPLMRDRPVLPKATACRFSHKLPGRQRHQWTDAPKMTSTDVSKGPFERGRACRTFSLL
ncbi:hypothetical protein [Tropicibacter oceani]|uniref:Uncharacterized protein n=1 Tax=Tropicibacter oceani TaxID=3058420 RepID=A0ABY8QP43_9RHOB|nr:hypothetical protein [Tropicibacter oceani]WGW05897.1 hypothetical protein QF118_03510 [Tropicibacter oceani]